MFAENFAQYSELFAKNMLKPFQIDGLYSCLGEEGADANQLNTFKSR